MSTLSVNINFVIMSLEDPKKILIGDTSNWGVAQNLPAYLKVIPPGSTKSINLNFAKNTLTTLKSTNLGLQCLTGDCNETEQIDLQDGIWEFCLQSSFNNLNKKRWFLKDDSLRLEIDKIYIKAGIDYNPDSVVIEALSEIEFLLTSARAHIKKGDFVKAKRAFDEATKLTEKYNQCKECY